MISHSCLTLYSRRRVKVTVEQAFGLFDFPAFRGTRMSKPMDQRRILTKFSLDVRSDYICMKRVVAPYPPAREPSPPIIPSPSDQPRTRSSDNPLRLNATISLILSE